MHRKTLSPLFSRTISTVSRRPFESTMMTPTSPAPAPGRQMEEQQLTGTLTDACVPAVEHRYAVTTCSVNVKVCRFAGHISHLLQSWTAGLDPAGVAHGLRHVHHERASIDVLPSKQHLHLGGGRAHRSHGRKLSVTTCCTSSEHAQ